MSGVAGSEIKMALKKAVTWGTAVPAGANDGFLSLPSSIKRDAAIDVDDSLGQYFSKDGSPGPVSCAGDIPMYMRYDGLDLLLAMILGVAGVPVQQAATIAYAYTYKWAENTDGIFATLAQHMKNYIAEVPSLKIVGFTLSGEMGEKPLQLSVSCVGDDKIPNSLVNTLAAFNNVTIFEVANRIRMSEGVFRMNDQSGAALGSGDQVYPSAFSLTAKRNLKGQYTSQYKSASPNVQDLIDEPTNDGPPELALSLTFPRHTGSTRLIDLGSDTRKKMDMVFTGGLIATPYNREFKLQFPHLQMKSVDVADAQGNINEPVELNIFAADAAPTGMTGITDPFWISGINKRTADPLA